MARGGFPGMPGGNMQQMLMKAQKMQQQVLAKQAELEQQEMEASAGGGMVTATVNGKHQLVRVAIKPEAVDPDDLEMLEDMIVAAVNEGMRMIDEHTEAEMAKITGGMKLGF